MERLGWTNVGLKGIFDVLSTRPVLNGVHATISLHVYLRDKDGLHVVVITGNDLHHAHVSQPGQLFNGCPFLVVQLCTIKDLGLWLHSWLWYLCSVSYLVVVVVLFFNFGPSFR
jgi:hypothetical protein